MFRESTLISLWTLSHDYPMIITEEIRREWESVGNRVREIRKSKDMTLEEIAVKSKQSESSVCQFEQGICSTSINYALFLRNEYGASFDWIYEGDVVDRMYKDRMTKKEFNPIEIGNRIKSVRKTKGMTLKELGLIAGISLNGISQFETGLNLPRIETAKKLKQAIGKPLDWIYFGDEIVIPKSVTKAKKREKL